MTIMKLIQGYSNKIDLSNIFVDILECINKKIGGRLLHCTWLLFRLVYKFILVLEQQQNQWNWYPWILVKPQDVIVWKYSVTCKLLWYLIPVDTVWLALPGYGCAGEVCSHYGRSPLGYPHGAALWNHGRWWNETSSTPIHPGWWIYIPLGNWKVSV